jgi:hypothetical protein
MANTISAKSEVVSRYGSASERIPAPALHLACHNQKIGRVAREPVNGRSDHHVAGREGLHQLSKLRPVGRGAGDLVAEYLLAPGRLELTNRLLSSWAAVENRA